MEESKMLGNGYLNVYGQIKTNTKTNEGTIISNWYLSLSLLNKSEHYKQMNKLLYLSKQITNK